ncbi:MAG: LPS-assembly protein LptD [Prevotellaceae bacterium]|nr:LPS-assembly protein LptD [Prevotellaceae bacterium]
MRVGLVLIFLVIGFFLCVGETSAQNIKGRPEAVKEKDTKLLDSLNKVAADSVKLAHKGALTQIIEYSSTDSLIYDFGETDTLVLMYKEAKVISEEEGLQIDADFFQMNRRTLMFFATGMPDSVGNIVGKPVFKEGGGEYKMDTLTYNYNTKRARILNVITKDGEGYLHGAITKRTPDGSSFIKDGKYTTCDLEHPHFYLKMTRGKVVEGAQRKVVFGPSYMVIEDVPFPLMLPFGFFPQMSDRSSGIKFPTFGEEVLRGFFLENLGIYFAMGEYMDLEFTGSIYSLGSWSARAASRYTKRYKYDGGFNLEYNFNVTGEKGSTDYRESKTFKIQWNHRQSPKARPGTNFSASVNFSSVSADKFNNQHDPYQSINNTASSSISYSKTWEGSPFNFSANFNHSQNMSDSTYAITFPNFTFSVSRIYPFKPKESVGKKKMWEDISLTYSTSFDNKINFKSSEVGTPDFMKKMNNGMRHSFGISLPSFTLFKYINLSPSVSYGMNWFFKTKKKYWDAVDNEVKEDIGAAFSDFGVTQEYSFSASMDTRLYGLVQFKKGSAIQAIRHVLKPSIGISYTPNMRTHANGWRRFQSGVSVYDVQEYNIYEGQANSAPSSSEAGAISFSLGNTLEMKVRDRKDTTAKGGYKKISILDNLNISASYNLLADSMNLSNINISGSTNILGKLGLTFGASIDPYAINDRGIRINKFYWADKGGLNIGELKSFNFSFGYSFSGGKADIGGNNQDPNMNIENNLSGVGNANMSDNRNVMSHEDHILPVFSDPFVYQDFNVPWALTFSYSYQYSKSWSYLNNTLKANKNHIQTLNFNGTLSPSRNWKINFSSGFDFKMKKLTTTRIKLSRDLHCFNFWFEWVPIGFMQSWSFHIAITSSMLEDMLKYDKRSSPWDN